MAYFALISNQNIVEAVHIVDDKYCSNGEWPEGEIAGQIFCQNEFGPGRYLMTSRNNQYRKRYAGIGMIYIEDRDVFCDQQPFPSWVLNEDDGWEAPKAMPKTGGPYQWDEETLSWVAVTGE